MHNSGQQYFSKINQFKFSQGQVQLEGAKNCGTPYLTRQKRTRRHATQHDGQTRAAFDV